MSDHDRDLVDRLLGQWAEERPDLDATPMGVVGRALRLSVLLRRRVEETLRPFGLTVGQFDVLATLRRSGGPPYRLTPNGLMEEVMLSSGAMTHQIDRLESAGLVRRRPDEDDRRSVQVELTPKGRALIDRAIPARFEEAAEVCDHLTATERRRLESSLRRLLLALEASTPR